MNGNYIENISLLVIFLYLFFGCLLFSYQKGNRQSKLLLGSFFLVMGLIILDVFFQQTKFYEQHLPLNFWLNSFPLLLGPLLWLLAKSVTSLNFQWQNKYYFHFLPFLISFFSFIFVFHLRSPIQQQVFVEKALTGNHYSVLLSSFILFVILSIYIYYAYLYLLTYRQQLREQLSDLDKINLSWLEHVLLGFMVIAGGTLFIQILYATLGKEHFMVEIALFVLLIGLLFFILRTIIKGIKSEDIFAESFKPILIEKQTTTKDRFFDPQQLDKLRTYMSTQQVFLEPSINLNDLAAQMEMNPRDLSNLINQGAQQSFYDFINAYRIEFAKQQMVETKDRKQTILEVMYAAGFNSKSSFNTAFKKHTQLTPSQWKKLHS